MLVSYGSFDYALNLWTSKHLWGSVSQTSAMETIILFKFIHPCPTNLCIYSEAWTSETEEIISVWYSVKTGS